MEIVSIILFLLVLTYTLINWRKALLMLAPFSVIFQPYLCLRYESPALSLLLFFQIIYLAVYYTKGRRLKFKEFPLRKAFVLLFLSQIIGLIVSPLPLMSNLPWLFSTIISYLFVIAYYNELQTGKDVILSVKGLLVAFVIMSIYFLYEYTSQSNPLVEYLWSHLPIEKEWIYYTSEERFGKIRCQSIMAICISWGAFGCMILWFVNAVMKNKIRAFSKWLLYYIALVSSLAVVSSGSRSAYVFAIFFVISFIVNYKGKYRFLFRFALLLAICMSFGLIASYFSDLFSDNITGSNINQRQLQFIAAFSVIESSPLWGFGIKGIESLRSIGNTEVLGAESIWLQQLISYGLIGVYSQFYIYRTCYKFSKQINPHNNATRLFLFGWITFSTMSSSPGLTEAYFLLLFFLLSKLYHLKTARLS